MFSATLYERLASHPDMDIPRAFALARLAALDSGRVGAELARLYPAAHSGSAAHPV
jgi:hypothetical protein